MEIYKYCSSEVLHESHLLFQELSTFNFFLVEISRLDDEGGQKENPLFILGNNKISIKDNSNDLKQEIIHRFKETKTNFMTICFAKDKKYMSICFEDNCFIFQIGIHQGNNSEDNNDSLRHVSEMKEFIIKILSNMNKVELLFSRKAEMKHFTKHFFQEKANILFPNAAKSVDIEEEVSSLEVRIDRTNFSIVNDLSSRALIAYIIRRNYYESSSFFDPSFFNKEINPQNEWEPIFDGIATQEIDKKTLSPDKIKEKFQYVNQLNLQKFDDIDIIPLRSIRSNDFILIQLVLHVKTCKLLIRKKYLKKPGYYFREKENFLHFHFKHPNILRCYGFEETPESNCLFFEFMCNDTLKTLLTTQQLLLTDSMKYKIYFSIIFALEYFSKKSFIHRDLKPDNIFIDHDFNIFVGDFNQSKKYIQNSVSDCFGSVKYLAPEIYRGENYSYSADIYSFGVITFEVFSGELLCGNDVKSVFQYINTHKLPCKYYDEARICNDCIKEGKNERININDILKYYKSNLDIFVKNVKITTNQSNVNKILKISIMLINNMELNALDFYGNLLVNFMFDEMLNSFQAEKILKLLKLYEIMNWVGVLVIFGNLYFRGVLFASKDFNKAFHYFTLSANQNDPSGQFWLGMFFLKGYGEISEDIDKAIFYLSLSAEQNKIESQYHLGDIYNFRKIDIKKALHYYEQSAKNNNINSLEMLGDIYLNGKGEVTKSITKAVHYYEISANLNSDKALYTLGEIYCHGNIGIPNDINKALHYLEISAGQNYSESQNLIGIIYCDGLGGIKRDIKKAINYFELASSKCNLANLNLANIYRTGNGVPKNIEKAIHYFENAVKSNIVDAQYDLAMIYLAGEGGIQKDINKAIHYLELASNLNEPVAMFSLGAIYHNGKEIPMDIKKAIHYFEKAALLGYNKASNALGSIYFFGKGGIPKDTLKAISYYKLSAKNNDNFAIRGLARIYRFGFKNIEKDINKAIHYLKLSSQQNESDSQYTLGLIYYKGKDIDINMNEAMKYFMLAADHKHKEALYCLGQIYYKGVGGIEKDWKRAFHYYELAANQNHINSQSVLGVMYYWGEGVSKNVNKAIYYYEQAGRKDKNALHLLGEIYFKGEGGIPKNIVKAIQYFKISAKNGSAGSQIKLGIIFRAGECGIPRNIKKAIKYFQLAASNNTSKKISYDAQYFLGCIYWNGEGEITKDITKAIYYYQLSSEKGHPIAQYLLGFIYHNGDKDTYIDYGKAKYYYELSANQNYPLAQNNLGIMFQNGEGTPKNISKAKHYFMLSAEQNNSNAAINLGNIYRNGIQGVPRNMIKAVHYYELSAEKNNADAQSYLGDIYYLGEGGIPVNINKAIHYFELSAMNNNHRNQFLLGIYYHFYSNEVDKAMNLYKEAANFRIHAAKNNLGVMYMKMYEEGKNESISRIFLGLATQYFNEAGSNNDVISMLNLALIYHNKIGKVENKRKVIDLIYEHLHLRKIDLIIDEAKIDDLINKISTHLAMFENLNVVPSKFKFNYIIYDYFKNKINSIKAENCDSDFYAGLINK